MTAYLFPYCVKHIWYPSVALCTYANFGMVLDNCFAHRDELSVCDSEEYISLLPNVTSVYKPIFQDPIVAVE